MKPGKKKIITLVLLCIAFFNVIVYVSFRERLYIIPEEDIPLCDKMFAHVEGANIVDETGALYEIKSIGFGNACWDNPSVPVYNYNSEVDYKLLAELGFNTVRYYLNYGIFEDDSSPFVYKEEGFRWLDQNVEWAKKYNIKILFNMHYPQGGFQSLGNGMALWENTNQEQERLVALWREIAKRYADESTVLGYGLVNEPFIPWQGSVDSTMQKWQYLAQNITNEIRKVDRHHIIFVESVFATKEVYSGTIATALSDNGNFVTVEDPCKNLVYETHFYNPAQFTHMPIGTDDVDWDYPNAERAMPSNVRWVNTTYNEGIAISANSDGMWHYTETNLYTPADNVNILYPGLAVFFMAGSGVIYYDDIVVSQYDKAGNYIKDIWSCDFSEDESWRNLYDNASKAQTYYVSDMGCAENGCVAIENADVYASLTADFPVYLVADEDYLYKVSAWVKCGGTEQMVVAGPQIVWCYNENACAYNKDYLVDFLETQKSYTDAMGAPLFIGEFGILEETYNHGGAQWLSDFIEACIERNIGFNYHAYHGEGFGLYTDSQYSSPTTVNSRLWDVFLHNLAIYR